MKAGSLTNSTRFDARRIVIVGALVGALAGMMMALTEMIYGWVSSTHTAWYAPMAIWAWLVGLNHFGQPANHIGRSSLVSAVTW
jgi:cobalamin synthase